MATNNTMHNLVTLIKRLEAATTRLEDIAQSAVELPHAVPGLQQGVGSVESSSSSGTPAPLPSVTPAAAEPPEELPESIEQFNNVIESFVQKYVALSTQIGGAVGEQALMLLKGFQEEKNFLLVSTKAKKPDVNGADGKAYEELLKPIQEAIVGATSIKDANRGTPVFNHLNAVAEGIMLLGWITLESKPFKHVDESLNSAQFFGNRVLKEFKDKDPQHTEWVQAYYCIFRELSAYVKEYFPNGIPWNPKGEPFQQAVKAAKESAASVPAKAPPATAGGPPPPPPPPPGPPPVLKINEEKPAPAPAAGGFNAVFSELNKGEAVTKGLRKVDKSEMTHKNPALRAGSTVPDLDSSAARAKSPAPGKKPKPESMRVKKPPKKELVGNKWTIENYEKPSEPIEITAELTHSILISRCNNTTIIVRGKANAVTVENTTRLSLIVDTLVSSVDVVKSQNFALQVLGTIPTILMDQIDGAQIYLSRASQPARIYSSKSANINLNVIAGPDDDDYKELALPSQLCSYFDEKSGELVNEIVDHAG